MLKKSYSSDTIEQILGFMKSEITEHLIYKRLAASCKKKKNRRVLESIAGDELKHYNFWKKHAGRDVMPDSLKVLWYYWIARLFGLTFGVKLMENGEEKAQETYKKISRKVPAALKVAEDENRHERELIELIDEERLKYVGSVVLGLNDALVELTGALAGLTFALQNAAIIAVAGLITGIAASFSMAASEYLSTKTEGNGKHPTKAAFYTGLAYIFTVALLVAPFFLLENLFASLALMLLNAVLVIFVFTFYISVAKDLDFRKRFLEMVSISLGIAALSFAVGFLVRVLLNIEV